MPDYRTHDEIQWEAQLRICQVCRRWWYMTHPWPICHRCRREAWREPDSEALEARRAGAPQPD